MLPSATQMLKGNEKMAEDEKLAENEWMVKELHLAMIKFNFLKSLTPAFLKAKLYGMEAIHIGFPDSSMTPWL